jgi:hypothetical protein
MTAVHVFDPANQSDAADWWTTIYTRAFVDYVSHEVVTDIKRQKLGMDHVVHLTNGATLNIDVKTRANYHDDILLEVWSSKEQRKPGWLRQSLHCHYIAYAAESHGLVTLVPFHLMRRAYEQNKQHWKTETTNPASGVVAVSARNVGYTTVSVAVPWDEFMRALVAAMKVWLDVSEPF